MVHGANYHDEANDKIISLAMIETVEALENVEKIAATEGINWDLYWTFRSKYFYGF